MMLLGWSGKWDEVWIKPQGCQVKVLPREEFDGLRELSDFSRGTVP